MRIQYGGMKNTQIAALYQCSMSGDPLCIPVVLVTVAERETCSCQMFLVGAVVENVLMGLNMNQPQIQSQITYIYSAAHNQEYSIFSVNFSITKRFQFEFLGIDSCHFIIYLFHKLT